MNVVYIASPYRSDSISGRLYNVGMARQYCRIAVEAGYVPVAPHLFYPQFLDDGEPKERAQGLSLALGDLAACDELWVFGEPSEGMRREIDLADSFEMPIRFFPSEASAADVIGVVGGFPALSKYAIILADPPWAYSSRATWKKSRAGGGVRGHYNVMPTADIAALPVSELAAQDAALFLWATWPNLPDALKVMEAWGFKYRTLAFVWVKTTSTGKVFFGPGYYTGSNTEVVLLGVRGRMKPVHNDVSQVVHAQHPRGADGHIIHSRKPAEVRERIVRLLGDLPRLELFAREAPEGWDVLGDQAPGNPVLLQPRSA